ncbi:MAG TPA: ornithine--oxo-acid transaminase [Elusimicrobia bacterium]|nr:ornithine--oxo-acid transaminase [Elusimicrobiota bacterium]HBT62000.1 ornithine--oxo-acid transaminase [Elusimicrobiota bacterium]
MITTATAENKSVAQELMELAEKHGAHNYHPLPIVISEAKGVWVKDPEGCKYLDMLSSYSALNHGHRHPAVLKALIDQAKKVTLTSRAFHNDQIGPFLKELSELTGFAMALPMNSGAEAVETAVKTARKWGCLKKGLAQDQAEIIVAANNFHGRTVTIISFSSDEQYRRDFGPMTPGFKIVPFGDAEALRAAITPRTVAFLVEPIQAEAGILIPPPGYLQKVREICSQSNVLLMADEIQTGMGRTGKMFAFEHEGIRPDVLILGKALGGGVMPISVVCADEDVLGVYKPGDHGSTFGGNPLACAVARAAIKALKEENLVERSARMGEYLMGKLNALKSGYVKEIRGRGLLVGIELHASAGGARRFCEDLMRRGMLCKETHEHVIRLAPPLVITEKEIDWAFSRLKKVLGG